MTTTFLLSLLSVWLNQQTDHTLKINVKNIQKDTGYIMIAVYDEDGDGSLGTNMFKIPNEPIGFSNNPSSFFGSPSFKKARFSFQEKSKQINIKLN